MKKILLLSMVLMASLAIVLCTVMPAVEAQPEHCTYRWYGSGPESLIIDSCSNTWYFDNTPHDPHISLKEAGGVTARGTRIRVSWNGLNKQLYDGRTADGTYYRFTVVAKIGGKASVHVKFDSNRDGRMEVYKYSLDWLEDR